jgi:hypothetical protein
MKKSLVVFVAFALAAGDLLAQVPPGLPQKARKLGDRINQRHQQGDPENSPATPPPGAPAKPAAPAPASQPALPPSPQQIATKLKADLTGVHAKGEATADAKKEFVQDLFAAVRGNSQPSPAVLAKFGESLLTAVAAKGVTLTDESKLVQNIITSLNCAGLSASRLKEINDEVQALLTKSGAAADAAAEVGDHLRAVATEIQTSAAR